MVTQERITALKDEIVRKFRPDKVILFGSYAHGQPTQESDVDLLVVLPFEGQPLAKNAEIRLAVKVDFALDLIAFSEPYLRDRIELGDFFLQEITAKGKVLYATANS